MGVSHLSLPAPVTSLVSRMKPPRGADPAAPMEGGEGITELLTELRVSRGPGGLRCRPHRGGTTLP